MHKRCRYGCSPSTKAANVNPERARTTAANNIGRAVGDPWPSSTAHDRRDSPTSRIDHVAGSGVANRHFATQRQAAFLHSARIAPRLRREIRNCIALRSTSSHLRHSTSLETQAAKCRPPKSKWDKYRMSLALRRRLRIRNMDMDSFSDITLALELWKFRLPHAGTLAKIPGRVCHTA